MKKQLKHAVRFGLVFLFGLNGISIPQNAAAQVTLTGTNYTQDFDSLTNGMPLGWSVDTGMTASSSGYDVNNTFFLNIPATNTNWNNTTGRFKNVASGIPYNYFADATSASQLSQSNRALGLRQNAALDKNVGFILKIANTTGFNNFMLSFNLQSLDSGASRITTWIVDYGIGSNPSSFIPAIAAGTMTTGGNQFSKNIVTVDFGNALDNKQDTVCIRILSLIPTTGTGNRTTSAIDNYSLSWSIMPPPSHIELLAKAPVDTAVALSTNQLALHYDNLIQAGSGQIDLYKTGNVTPTSFTVPSAAINISDSTAIVNGVNLENNTSYYVLMSAGTFIRQGDTLPNHAITDTAYWTFSTVDTTSPPPPPSLNLLEETFTNCADTAMGHFAAYNHEDSRTWHCVVYGHADSSAVAMSGGIAAGLSDSSRDWLISNLPFKLSSMTMPILSFWQKRRFEGEVIRTIKVSTNYQSGTNPDSATWAILQVQDMSHIPAADVWTQVNDIDLTDFKNTPFHLAFTYECGETGAYELSYDDIVVEDKPLSIPVFSRGDIDLKVLGEANCERIVLSLDVAKATDLNILLYNMTGKVIYRKHIKAKAGHQEIVLENINTVSGVYAIRVTNEANSAVVKTFVR